MASKVEGETVLKSTKQAMTMAMTMVMAMTMTMAMMAMTMVLRLKCKRGLYKCNSVRMGT